MKSVIQLKSISKAYISGDVETPVLHDLSISIRAGEFLAIIGPSGSGKSTLLNILGLLDNATTGIYELNGINVTKLSEDEQAHVRNKEIGFVFQQFNLLKRESVLENVILPAIYAGTPEEKRIEKAKQLLENVGLGEHMYKRPNQLSGGQQQRVAIARSLMNDPAIILADEPTGNLDTKSGHDVMELLKSLHKEGRTIIVITHDDEIARQAKRVIAIRDGKVV